MPTAKITLPNDAERRWLTAQLVRAQHLAGQHGDAAHAASPSLAALDRAWVAGSAELRVSGGDPNPLIQAIGIALGQRLVDRLGLAWVVATDGFGTELAVHGEPGDVLVYPLNLVAKRWERGTEEPFLEALYESMESDVVRIQKGLGPR
jgi:hypothetical protein